MTEPTNGERREAEIGRAAFLKSSALAVLGVAFGYTPGAASAATGEIAAFLRLSRVASGANDLPITYASKYFAALEAEGVLKLKPSRFAKLAGFTASAGPTTMAELEKSATYQTPAGKECVHAVAAAWWSGTVPTPGGGQKTVTFSDALVWRQVHEPTTCQGATGSWSKPGRAIG